MAENTWQILVDYTNGLPVQGPGNNEKNANPLPSSGCPKGFNKASPLVDPFGRSGFFDFGLGRRWPSLMMNHLPDTSLADENIRRD